ncbi:MAG: hypothetical protein AAGJ46_17775 [Planctomycetota bacterium]
MLRQILTARFGMPTTYEYAGSVFDRWREGTPEECSVLLPSQALIQNACGGLQFSDLYGDVYGDIYGAFLGGETGALKVACRSRHPVYGLRSIEQLNSHPALQEARDLLPGIVYFMDAANVVFYGVIEGKLFAFDTEDAVVECLGAIESGVVGVLEQWC